MEQKNSDDERTPGRQPIDNDVLDAMAHAAWEKLGMVGMEEVRVAIELMLNAAWFEGYQLRSDAMVENTTRKLAESVNAYTSTDALRSALARCERAMKPFAAKVYNDNHDLTVSDTYRLTFEEYAAIYFAHKAAHAALSVSPAPSIEGLREWQPIETAPKDGTEILWNSPNPDPNSNIQSYCVIHWPEYAECFEEGYWQPLPPAPDAARTALAGVTAPSEVDAK
jgi:hypothetical protein